MLNISRLTASAALVMCAQSAMAQTQSGSSCELLPYTVYFDANSDTITAEGAEILDTAAMIYLKCGQSEVVISGHTDRKGSDSDNVALSYRMAVNVGKYLAGRNIPAGVMTTQVYGETRPQVDTADGVSEAQNRRVEITFAAVSGW